MRATIRLAQFSLGLTVLIGVPLGVWAGTCANRAVNWVISVFTFVVCRDRCPIVLAVALKPQQALAEKRIEEVVKVADALSTDWMATDVDIACPDPNYGGIFQTRRVGARVFRHRDVTAALLKKGAH